MKSFNDLKIGDVVYEIANNKFYRNIITEIIPNYLYSSFCLRDQNGSVWCISISNTINESIYYFSSSHLLIADKKVFHDLCRNDFVI